MTTLINIPLDLKELHHELRTPLTGLGVIEILRQDKTLTPKQQDELLEMAEQCVQRLLNTVTQILSSPTKKTNTYNPQLFSPKENVVIATNDSINFKENKMRRIA